MPNRNVIAGLVLALLAVVLWRVTRPAPAYDFRPTQLTFDTGVTAYPAISRDGRTVAYASDRDSNRNLELYVQPVRGGSPLRLTNGTASVTSTDFSPDGATLAFTAGGSVYTVPVSGGEPHLLAAGGPPVRYSPDGRWIAASNGAGMAILSATSGAAAPFHPELRGDGLSWSPDGASLIFWADNDFRVAKREGGPPEAVGVAQRLNKAGIGPGPFPDAVWTRHGLIFSARTGFARNLYLCPLDRRGKSNRDIVRLTNGTELLGDPAISSEGRIVFSSSRQRFDVWSIPLDAGSGKARGEPSRLTDSLAPTANPELSTDGKRLIYGSSRHGFTEVWEKDLLSGAENVVATSPEGASYGRIVRSSTQILHARPIGGRIDVYLGDRKLAEGTRAWDAGAGASTVLLMSGAAVDELQVQTMQRRPFLAAPEATRLVEASYSADDRWIAFAAVTKDNSRIYVVSAQGGEWKAVTGGGSPSRHPRFSPDGRTIDYISDRDGGREIDAISFDPQTGSVSGEPFTVYRPASARLSLLDVSVQALDIALAGDKLVTIFCEQSSAIWIGDLVLQ